MKTLFVAVLSLFAAHVSLGQKCVAPTIGTDRGICAQMVVEFAGPKAASQFTGIVVDVNDKPIPEAVIEIYTADKNGELVLTYKTDDSGRFCIANLKKGKYRMKVGWSRFAFNCTEMRIEISGKTKRFLQVSLEVGH
jgi:hypothetical protein